MFVTIGRAPRPVSAHPVDALLTCHARIRGFNDVARSLAECAEASSSERAAAATAVARYFEIALPLHVADEEDSLAPRLLAAAHVIELPDALARMTREHDEIEELLSALIPIWHAIAAAPDARGPSELALVTRLADLFESHLALEEATLFPRARELSSGDLATLGAEMAARRLPRAR